MVKLKMSRPVDSLGNPQPNMWRMSRSPRLGTCNLDLQNMNHIHVVVSWSFRAHRQMWVLVNSYQLQLAPLDLPTRPTQLAPQYDRLVPKKTYSSQKKPTRTNPKNDGKGHGKVYLTIKWVHISFDILPPYLIPRFEEAKSSGSW